MAKKKQKKQQQQFLSPEQYLKQRARDEPAKRHEEENPMNIEPHAGLPSDMKDNYYFGEM